MAETKMQLVDWLDDLCVRFIINLQQEELESVERICFQVEEAQWFYEDFVRPLDPTLPSLSLRQFCLLIFQRCPFLAPFSEELHAKAFEQFLQYKTRVPVRGAILLNDTMDEVLLVRGWKKGANWSFPRGKINKDEKDLDCAVREVYEETGYDLRAAGLVAEEPKMKHIEVTMREQHMKLYVFRGVPLDTAFQPRTRKEIGKISWFRLMDLPGYKKRKANKQASSSEVLSANKMYMVAPFLNPLKKWISQQQRYDRKNNEPELVSDADGVMTDDYQTGADEANFLHQDYSLHSNGNLGFQPSIQSRHFDPGKVQMGVDNYGASNQLKGLLGVNERDNHSQSNKDNLLSLFRGSTLPNQSHVSQGPQQPVQTPVDQIQNVAQEPLEPRQMHTTAPNPQSTTLPAPHFPNLRQYQTEPFHQQYQQPSDWGLTHHHSFDQPATSFSGQTSNFFGPMSYQSYHRPQSYVSYPFRQVGDLQFGQGNIHENQTSSVPTASMVPKPKLSTHAQSLLDVFKGSAPTPPTSQAPLSRPDRQSAPQTQPIGSHLPGSHRLSTSESRSRQALDKITEPQAIAKPSLPADNQSAMMSPPQLKPSPHQAALLKLFQPPDGTLQTATAPIISQTNQQPDQPAELAAMPVKPTSYNGEPAQQPPAEFAPLGINSLQKQSKVEIPAELSDSSTVKPSTSNRRKPREGKAKKEVEQQKPSSTNQAPFTTVQILKRPTSSSDQKEPYPAPPTQSAHRSQEISYEQPRTPVKASVQSKKPNKSPRPTSSDKPFTPQILKRPQQPMTSSTPSVANNKAERVKDLEEPVGPAKNATPGSVRLLKRGDSQTEKEAPSNVQNLLALFKQTKSSSGAEDTTSPTREKVAPAVSTLLSEPTSAKPAVIPQATPSAASPFPIGESRIPANSQPSTPATVLLHRDGSLPQSPLPGQRQEQLLSRSRINSVESVPKIDLTSPSRSLIPSPATSASAFNTPVKRDVNADGDGRISSGVQTPMTSKDRGFLMSYLEGVVKGAHVGTLDQGVKR